MLAAMNGHNDAVLTLLDMGADINAQVGVACNSDKLSEISVCSTFYRLKLTGTLRSHWHASKVDMK